jgi:hypothetical protein
MEFRCRPNDGHRSLRCKQKMALQGRSCGAGIPDIPAACSKTHQLHNKQAQFFGRGTQRIELK